MDWECGSVCISPWVPSTALRTKAAGSGNLFRKNLPVVLLWASLEAQVLACLCPDHVLLRKFIYLFFFTEFFVVPPTVSLCLWLN
jgi:hypothetical protein